MPDLEEECRLEERHYITLILRLTLDRGARLLQGELLDSVDARHQRFAGVTGLRRAIQDWLNRHVHDEEP
jgi:hypothetical protein